MPLYHKYQLDRLTVGVWRTDETEEQLLALFHNLSLYEEGLSRFTSPRRRIEWLSVRALLKELCGEEKEIAYLPTGKPYLTDNSACISFSHTSGYVSVAIHPSEEVAVDIEQYGDRVKRVAHKFIRPDERPTIQENDEIYTLLLHWSAKETLFKLMDKEGVDFVTHLQVMPFRLKKEGTFIAREYRSEEGNSYLIHYDTHADYVLTFACKA